MTVVSNTSPIINLAAVGQLHLLPQLFGTLSIPPAVRHEIVIMGANQPGAHEVATWAAFREIQVSNPALVQALRLQLDAGEAEAIACAIEYRSDWLLIDERRGRIIARQFGLRVLGLLGVLLQAKREGLIGAVAPILPQLTHTAGFWMDQALQRRVLIAADEAGES